MGTGQVSATLVTIASGQSLSGALDLGAGRLAMIHMPAAWTAANLTFQASFDGTTFSNLYDASGNEVVVTVAADRAVRLSLGDWLGMQRLKIRSGTSAVPVNQAANRDLQLVAVP